MRKRSAASLQPHPEVPREGPRRTGLATGVSSGFNRSSLRQIRQGLVIHCHQRFLLSARPALDLALAGDGVDDAVIGFGEDEFDGAALGGVVVIGSGIMLLDARLDLLLGEAGII